MGTITKSVTVIPSGTTGRTNMSTSSNYPESRGYNDTSNSSFARWTLSTSTTGYIYYTFDIDTSDVPAGATITEVTAKARCYVNNTTRVTNTVCQLYSGTTAKGNNATFASTSNTNIVTLDTGNSWTRSDLNDLRIRIGATGSSSTSSKYVYFAGAEVVISYSVTTYTCSASGDGTLSPSGSVDVESGGSYVLSISDITDPTATDNNVDVTSQLVESTTATLVKVPDGNTNSGFTLSNISNAYNDASNSTYASLELNGGGSTGTLYLNTNVSLPTGAALQSVSCSFTYQYNRNNSSSGFTAYCQMASGTSAKGDAYSLVSAGGSDVAKTTINLSVGSWNASELANARLMIEATNNASSTHRFLYVYGLSFTVTYTSDGKIYTYTISSVSADHTIVVTEAAASDVLWFKADSVDTLIGRAEKVTYDDSGMPDISFSYGDLVPGDTCVATFDIHYSVSPYVLTETIEFTVPAYSNSSQLISKFGTSVLSFTIFIPSSSMLTHSFSFLCDYNPYGYYEVYKRGAGGWLPVTKAYKKISGSWVEQSDLTTVFDSNTNYIRGD